MCYREREKIREYMCMNTYGRILKSGSTSKFIRNISYEVIGLNIALLKVRYLDSVKIAYKIARRFHISKSVSISTDMHTPLPSM